MSAGCASDDREQAPHSVGIAELMSQGMSGDERGTIVAPSVRDLDDLTVALTGWLAGKLIGARDLRLSSVGYPRGSGQSAETVLFDATWRQDGRDHVHGFVVRIKPTSFSIFIDDMFAEEFALMQLLGESGRVPIATVLWFEPDASVLGAPFFVMERLAGRVAVSIPSYLDVGWVADATPAQRSAMWEDAIRSLASVQSVPVAEASFLQLPGGGTGFDQEWDRWGRALAKIDRSDRPLPELRMLRDELRATVPTHRPEGIVWGDARLGNVLVGEDFRVVALMDWEQPSLGGALHDLGWWLISQRGKCASRSEVPLGVLGRDEIIAIWHETTGISTESIDWYEAFAAFKMSCCMLRMLELRGQEVPGGLDSLFHLRAGRELLAG